MQTARRGVASWTETKKQISTKGQIEKQWIRVERVVSQYCNMHIDSKWQKGKPFCPSQPPWAAMKTRLPWLPKEWTHSTANPSVLLSFLSFFCAVLWKQGDVPRALFLVNGMPCHVWGHDTIDIILRHGVRTRPAKKNSSLFVQSLSD